MTAGGVRGDMAHTQQDGPNDKHADHHSNQGVLQVPKSEHRFT